MKTPLVSQTLLLAPDLRQTVLANFGLAGVSRQSYSAYGYQHGPGASRTGFNGQVREPQGWYHLGNGHRIYNPVLGRFHSADNLSPFGKGGWNAYAYCLGDPINYTDPTGQFVDVLFNWAQPAFTLALNAFLLAVGLLTAGVAPAMLVGLGLWSARMSVVGATLGVLGSATQLATPAGSTVNTVARGVSLFGTGLAIGGAATRTLMQSQKLSTLSGSNWSNFRGGVNALARGYRSPAVSSSAMPGDIPMNTIARTTPGSPPLVPGTGGALSRTSSTGASAAAMGSPGSFERTLPISPDGSYYHSLSPGSVRSFSSSSSVASRAGSVRSPKNTDPETSFATLWVYN